jgi:hypothetical protein
MNKSKLSIYRFVAVILVATNLLLVYINSSLVNNIKINQESVSVFSVVSSLANVRRYGYTDAIKVLLSEDNIILTNIIGNSEGGSLIQVEAKYVGEVNAMYIKLKDLKDEENFLSLDKIKIDSDSENIQSNYFTVTFKMDK